MSEERFDPGNIAHKWWRELNGDPGAGEDRNSKGDPGAFARLRRASTPIEALAEARTIELAKRLGANPDKPLQLTRIGALAAVLAHVRGHNASTPMATLLGPDGQGENTAMSPLRFQRLMAAETPDDLMRQMRNAVKLLKGTANIPAMSCAIYYWNDRTRIRWTYEYWGAGNASPDATTRIMNTQQQEATQ